jgi:hypothetical protein
MAIRVLVFVPFSVSKKTQGNPSSARGGIEKGIYERRFFLFMSGKSKTDPRKELESYST